MRDIERVDHSSLNESGDFRIINAYRKTVVMFVEVYFSTEWMHDKALTGNGIPFL